jgi:ankyrin repeat protein
LAHGADVNARDNNGVTPLHIAAENGNCDLVSILIANGADVNVKDKAGESPLARARKSSPDPDWADCARVAEILSEHGAKD